LPRTAGGERRLRRQGGVHLHRRVVVALMLSVVSRATLLLVVIHASGGAARAGVAGAQPMTPPTRVRLGGTATTLTEGRGPRATRRPSSMGLLTLNVSSAALLVRAVSSGRVAAPAV